MSSIDKLIQGYRQFYHKYFASDDSLYQKLGSGQKPKILMIACSDSRVDPSIITNSRPGDIFVIRNVANLIPPFAEGDTGHHGVSAALEFAVCGLEVEHIIILGHSHCAGIKALIDSKNFDESDFIGAWVDIARSAKHKACAQIDKNIPSYHEALCRACEQEAILLSLQNLMSFPWIAARVADKKLQLHGWYFSIIDGSLQQYHPEKQCFEMINIR